MSELEQDRKLELFASVDAVAAVHREWIDSDTRLLTEGFENSINALIESAGSGMVPGGCRDLVAAVASLGQMWVEFSEYADPRDPDRAIPPNTFWRQLDEVTRCRSAATPRQEVVLESVAELREQKVSPAQICEIYEWKDEDGRPDFRKLKEEAANPGTHTGAGFVSPIEKRLAREDEAGQAEAEKMRAQRQAKIDGEAIAPESIATLVDQGVSARQIADMKQISVADVLEQCASEGIQTPALDYETLQAIRGTHEPDRNESQERILDAMGTPHGAPEVANQPEAVYATPGPNESTGLPEGVELVEEEGPASLGAEIIAYHEGGLNTRQIADAVSTHDQAVSWQKVGSVIRKWKADPEGFKLEEVAV